MMTDVSVLGTGLMGSAIARALLRNGLSVTVWNRSPDKAAALGDEGAVVAGSAAEALSASPVSLMVILAYENVRTLLEEAVAAGPVGDVINLVTGSPRQAQELGAWAYAHDIRVLDAALLTYPRGIGTPESLILCSGDAQAWESWRPLLQSLAGACEFLGSDIHLANAADHVTMSFVTAAQTALFEVLAMGRRLGLSDEAMVPRLSRATRAVGRYLEYAVPMLESGDYTTTEATIDTWTASSAGFAAAARELGLPAGVIDAAAVSIRSARDAGYGDLDLAALLQANLEAAHANLSTDPSIP